MNENLLKKFDIILASQSPRRRELLGRTGLSFAIRPASDREVTEETEPAKIVEALAAHKANEVYGKLLGERSLENVLAEASPVSCGTPSRPLFVIGADTVVVINGQILGKPESPEHAAEMLRMLSGAQHEVLTGVCLIREEPGAGKSGEEETGAQGGAGKITVRTHIFHECTKVFFRSLTEEEIASYIASGEPMDKAGAYGIQGLAGVFVDHIEGDYDNVVGFPLTRILGEAEAFLAEPSAPAASTEASAAPGEA